MSINPLKRPALDFPLPAAKVAASKAIPLRTFDMDFRDEKQRKRLDLIMLIWEKYNDEANNCESFDGHLHNALILTAISFFAKNIDQLDSTISIAEDGDRCIKAIAISSMLASGDRFINYLISSPINAHLRTKNESFVSGAAASLIAHIALKNPNGAVLLHSAQDAFYEYLGFEKKMIGIQPSFDCPKYTHILKEDNLHSFLAKYGERAQRVQSLI